MKKEKLINLIQNHHLEDFFEIILQTKNKHNYRIRESIILLYSRYKRLKEKTHNNEITNAEIDIELNKITLASINLIENMSFVRIPNNTNRKKWHLAYLLFLLVLTSAIIIIYSFNSNLKDDSNSHSIQSKPSMDISTSGNNSDILIGKDINIKYSIPLKDTDTTSYE